MYQTCKEPYEEKPHVRFCEGCVQQWARLPRLPLTLRLLDDEQMTENWQGIYRYLLNE